MWGRSITAEGLLAALEQGRRREEDWGSAIRWVVGGIVVVGVAILIDIVLLIVLLAR
jgi:hypothetical protein